MKWLKLAVSSALLWYVLGMVDWGEARGYVDKADLRYLVLFAAVLPITVALSVAKWWRLLAARGLHVSFGRLFGLYVTGQFYHNVLPSSVGGDVVRGVMVNKEIGSARESVSSIAAERLTGMTVLAVLGLVVVLGSPEIRQDWALIGASGLSVLAYVTVVALLLFLRIRNLGLGLIERFPWMKKVRRRLGNLQQSMLDYRYQKRALVECLLLSAGFYAATIVSAYLACRAVGEPVPFAVVLVAVPIVHLVGVLPITLNGIGLKEWASTAAFAALGAPPTVGLIVALLNRVRLIIWSVSGYAIWSMRNTARESATKSPPAAPAPPGKSEPGTRKSTYGSQKEQRETV
jgi:uncharacterized protein (TIRG00374 family)